MPTKCIPCDKTYAIVKLIENNEFVCPECDSIQVEVFSCECIGPCDWDCL